MKYIQLVLLFIVFSVCLTAQESKDSAIGKLNADLFPPKIILKFSPVNLVDFDTPGLGFSIEHQLREDHYMHHEITLLWGMDSRFKDNPMVGYRIRTGYRHYYRELLDDGYSNPFIEYLIKVKQSFRKGTSTFDRFDGLFREELETTMRSTSVGIYMAYGRQYFISSRLTLEWGVTLGWRWLQREALNVPEDAQSANFDFSLGEGTFSFPSTYLLFKLGYVLK